MAHARAGAERVHSRRGKLQRRACGGIDARFPHPIARRHRRPLEALPLVELVVVDDVGALGPLGHPGGGAFERLQPLRQLGRNLAHEARGRIEAQLAEERPAAGERERQPSARAGHADVAEAALLGQLVGIFFPRGERSPLAE